MTLSNTICQVGRQDGSSSYLLPSESPGRGQLVPHAYSLPLDLTGTEVATNLQKYD